MKFLLLLLFIAFVQSFTAYRSFETLSLSTCHKGQKHRISVMDLNIAMNMKNEGAVVETKSSSSSSNNISKRLILIRHGRTHMNEYLSKPGSQWGDENFTDVGLPDQLYRDSPLCQKGIEQAQGLYRQIQIATAGSKEGKNENDPTAYCVDDIDLVVVSPLTRTFQTLEYALLPHFKKKKNQNNADADEDHVQKPCQYRMPIVSLPLASERVYLKSDLGLPLDELRLKFPYAQFDEEFKSFEDEWWFTVTDKEKEDRTQSSLNNGIHSFNSLHISEYKEWRPISQNQTYEYLGEPDLQFNQRMVALYEWLDQRDEKCICMISHWGVLEWLTGLDFQNCEWREVEFDVVDDKVSRIKDDVCKKG